MNENTAMEASMHYACYHTAIKQLMLVFVCEQKLLWKLENRFSCDCNFSHCI